MPPANQHTVSCSTDFISRHITQHNTMVQCIHYQKAALFLPHPQTQDIRLLLLSPAKQHFKDKLYIIVFKSILSHVSKQHL